MKIALATALFILGSTSLMLPARAYGQAQSAPAAPAEEPERRLIKPFVAVTASGAVEIRGEEARDWTDPFGRSVSATLIGLSGALIGLDVQGQPMAYPLAGVSPADREYVRHALQVRGQAHVYPGTTNSNDEAASMQLAPSAWREQLLSWARTALQAQAPEQSSSAREHIRNVCDPAALSALTGLLRRQFPDPIRTAFVEAVAHIGGGEATKFLVELATNDRSSVVRASAAWALCHSEESERVLEEFAKVLRKKQSRDAALMALAMTGIMSRSDAVSESGDAVLDTLIDILVIKQPVNVPYYVWSVSGYAYAKPKAMGGGFHAHREGHISRREKTFFVPIPCELARKILVDNSGRDYAYDQQAWRRWYDER